MERQQQQHQPQTPLSQAQPFGRPHCAASDAYPELPWTTGSRQSVADIVGAKLGRKKGRQHWYVSKYMKRLGFHLLSNPSYLKTCPCWNRWVMEPLLWAVVKGWRSYFGGLHGEEANSHMWLQQHGSLIWAKRSARSIFWFLNTCIWRCWNRTGLTLWHLQKGRSMANCFQCLGMSPIWSSSKPWCLFKAIKQLCVKIQNPMDPHTLVVCRTGPINENLVEVTYWSTVFHSSSGRLHASTVTSNAEQQVEWSCCKIWTEETVQLSPTSSNS